jgi:hypothetical protein
VNQELARAGEHLPGSSKSASCPSATGMRLVTTIMAATLARIRPRPCPARVTRHPDVQERSAVIATLAHLGLPTEPPSLPRARDPAQRAFGFEEAPPRQRARSPVRQGAVREEARSSTGYGGARGCARAPCCRSGGWIRFALTSMVFASSTRHARDVGASADDGVTREGGRSVQVGSGGPPGDLGEHPGDLGEHP